MLDLKTGLPIPPEDGFLRPLSEETSLVKHQTFDSETVGVLRTKGAPMLFTSFPVLDNLGKGPIAGTLIFGRYLNPSKLAQISERAGVQFSSFQIGQERLLPGAPGYSCLAGRG